MSARLIAALSCSAFVSSCVGVYGSAGSRDFTYNQKAWSEACAGSDEWDKAAPPAIIYGNTYYVGTCGISAILIASDTNLTLIDSGTDAGAEIVLANIREVGRKPEDVKSIVMSHEHFDHVGGMARLQAATGATVYATPEAAKVLRSGFPDIADPQFRSGHPAFPKVTGKIRTIDGKRPLNSTEWAPRPIRTPGHTPGALSWTWRDCGGLDGCKTIVYVDSMNPISSDGYRFSDHPQLVAAFRKGIAEIAVTPCDIVIAPHPGAVDLRKRLAGEKPLIDPDGCKAFAASVTARLDKRLADEAASGG